MSSQRATIPIFRAKGLILKKLKIKNFRAVGRLFLKFRSAVRGGVYAILKHLNKFIKIKGN